MTRILPAHVLSLTLSLALSAAGCGGLVSGTPAVDESEGAALGIADTIPIGSDAEVYNTGGTGLNLRTGAGTGFSVVETMPEGTVVHLVGGPTNSFYNVTHGSKTGWAHMSYLRAVGGSSGYPTGINWVAANSGNYMVGRDGTSITKIVIHDTEGGYSGAISWFQDPASNVSAHYVIRSSDGDITQMVREQDTAYHAGNWNYNLAAIGIEHEGYMSDPGRWYTDVMYRRSAQLTAAIAKRYGIAKDRTHIIGHAEVPPPSTHTDPGPGWDWNKYMDLVKSFH